MKNKIRDLVDIEKDFINMELMSCKPNWKKPKIGEVIDENKSVKWNREEIDKLIKKYDEEVKN